MQYITKHGYASFTFELTNCDASPLELSKLTAKFIVKRSASDSDDDCVLFGEYVNPETNIISFQFNADETGALLEGNYVCALKLFSENKMNKEIWSDELRVVRGVFNG